MMVSDYDGSWESYIDEFAEMILSGLDAIWETSYGYPPDGARDLPGVQAVPAEPSGAVRGVLQRVPGGDGAEHRQRSGLRAGVRRRRQRSAARPAPADVMSAGAATRLPDDVLADIQGFITSGYGHLSYAAYLFVQFHDAATGTTVARTLSRRRSRSAAAVAADDADGKKVKPTLAVNIAFTADGLAALGLPPRVLCTFPSSSRRGSRVRTDRGSSATRKRATPAQVGIRRRRRDRRSTRS